MDPEGNIAGSELLRVVFRAIDFSSTVSSLAELNETFAPAITYLGFSLFAFTEVVDQARRPTLRIAFGEGFQSWERRYLERDYAPYDAVGEECRKGVDPFYWSDLLNRAPLSERARQVLTDAQSFGLHEGFVAPVHQPNGSIYAVLFAGQLSTRRHPQERILTHMLATYYGLAGQKLSTSPKRSSIKALTERQRECLRWVRAGKSSVDIGAILRISAGVVDEHVANACKRLGVSTRTQAVVTANALGYLDA